MLYVIVGMTPTNDNFLIKKSFFFNQNFSRKLVGKMKKLLKKLICHVRTEEIQVRLINSWCKIKEKWTNFFKKNYLEIVSMTPTNHHLLLSGLMTNKSIMNRFGYT